VTLPATCWTQIKGVRGNPSTLAANLVQESKHKVTRVWCLLSAGVILRESLCVVKP
jgi:hypothetical protein